MANIINLDVVVKGGHLPTLIKGLQLATDSMNSFTKAGQRANTATAEQVRIQKALDKNTAKIRAAGQEIKKKIQNSQMLTQVKKQLNTSENRKNWLLDRQKKVRQQLDSLEKSNAVKTKRRHQQNLANIQREIKAVNKKRMLLGGQRGALTGQKRHLRTEKEINKELAERKVLQRQLNSLMGQVHMQTKKAQSVRERDFKRRAREQEREKKALLGRERRTQDELSRHWMQAARKKEQRDADARHKRQRASAKEMAQLAKNDAARRVAENRKKTAEQRTRGALQREIALRRKNRQQVVSTNRRLKQTVGQLRLISTLITAAAFLRSLRLFSITLQRIMYPFRQLVVYGIQFNALMETTRIGVAAILTSTQRIVTESGRVLHGQEKFNEAMKISRGLQKQLQLENLRTAATYEQLLLTFQGLAGPARNAGFEIKELITFSRLVVTAVAGIGLKMNQAVQEGRDLLQGSINPMRSQLANALGIKNSMVKAWMKEGVLAKKLLQYAQAFELAGDEIFHSWEGIKSNTEDMLKIVAGTVFQRSFQMLKESGLALQRAMITIKKDSYEIRPVWVKIAGILNDAVVGSIGRLRHAIWELSTGQGLKNLEESFSRIVGMAESAFNTMLKIGSITIQHPGGVLGGGTGGLAGGVIAATIGWQTTTMLQQHRQAGTKMMSAATLFSMVTKRFGSILIRLVGALAAFAVGGPLLAGVGILLGEGIGALTGLWDRNRRRERGDADFARVMRSESPTEIMHVYEKLTDERKEQEKERARVDNMVSPLFRGAASEKLRPLEEKNLRARLALWEKFPNIIKKQQERESTASFSTDKQPLVNLSQELANLRKSLDKWGKTIDKYLPAHKKDLRARQKDRREITAMGPQLAKEEELLEKKHEKLKRKVQENWAESFFGGKKYSIDELYKKRELSIAEIAQMKAAGKPIDVDRMTRLEDEAEKYLEQINLLEAIVKIILLLGVIAKRKLDVVKAEAEVNKQAGRDEIRDKGKMIGLIKVETKALDELFKTRQKMVKETIVGFYNILGTGLDNSFFNIMTGKFKEMSDVGKEAVTSILKTFTSVAAEIARKKIVMSITAAMSGDSQGGFSGWLARDFQKGFAEPAKILKKTFIKDIIPALKKGFKPLGAMFKGMGGLGGALSKMPVASIAAAGGALTHAWKEMSGARGAMYGGLSGGAGGAAIGTAIAPGIGTLIGAGIGAFVGGLFGWGGGKKEKQIALIVRKEVEGRLTQVSDMIELGAMGAVYDWDMKRVGDFPYRQVENTLRNLWVEQIKIIENIMFSLPTEVWKKIGDIKDTRITRTGALTDVFKGGGESKWESTRDRLSFDRDNKEMEKVQKDWEQFLEGYTGNILMSLENFWTSTMETLGFARAGTAAWVQEQMREIAGLEGAARAAKGKEFLENTKTIVEAFNLISGNVGIKGAISNIQNVAASIGEMASLESGVPTLAGIHRELERLFRVGDHKNLRKLIDLRKALLAVQSSLIGMTSNTLQMLQGINEKLEDMGGTAIFNTGSLAQQLLEHIKGALSQPNLSLEERKGFLTQFGQVLDFMYAQEKKIADIRTANLQRQRDILATMQEISDSFHNTLLRIKTDFEGIFTKPEQIGFIQAQIKFLKENLPSLGLDEQASTAKRMEELYQRLYQRTLEAFGSGSSELRAVYSQIERELSGLAFDYDTVGVLERLTEQIAANTLASAKDAAVTASEVKNVKTALGLIKAEQIKIAANTLLLKTGALMKSSTSLQVDASSVDLDTTALETAMAKVKTAVDAVKTAVATGNTEAVKTAANTLATKVQAVKVVTNTLATKAEVTKVKAEAVKINAEAVKVQAEAVKVAANTLATKTALGLIKAEQIKIAANTLLLKTGALMKSSTSLQVDASTLGLDTTALETAMAKVKTAVDAVKTAVATGNTEAVKTAANTLATKVQAVKVVTNTLATKAEVTKVKAEAVKVTANTGTSIVQAVKVVNNTLATKTALGLIKAEQIKIAANTLLLKTGALMKSSASLQVSASSVDLDTTALETAMAKVKTAVDAVKTAVATGNTEAVKTAANTLATKVQAVKVVTNTLATKAEVTKVKAEAVKINAEAVKVNAEAVKVAANTLATETALGLIKAEQIKIAANTLLLKTGALMKSSASLQVSASSVDLDTTALETAMAKVKTAVDAVKTAVATGNTEAVKTAANTLATKVQAVKVVTNTLATKAEVTKVKAEAVKVTANTGTSIVQAVKVVNNTLATKTALGLIKAEQIKIAANTLLLKTGALMKSSASLQVSASSVDLDTTALETAMAKVKTAVDAVKTAVATGNTEAVKTAANTLATKVQAVKVVTNTLATKAEVTKVKAEAVKINAEAVKVNAEAVKVAANTLATETALGLIKAEQIKIAANTLLLKTGALMKSSASLQVSASSVDLDTTALETAMAKVKTAVDAVKTAVATGNTEAVKTAANTLATKVQAVKVVTNTLATKAEVTKVKAEAVKINAEAVKVNAEAVKVAANTLATETALGLIKAEQIKIAANTLLLKTGALMKSSASLQVSASSVDLDTTALETAMAKVKTAVDAVKTAVATGNTEAVKTAANTLATKVQAVKVVTNTLATKAEVTKVKAEAVKINAEAVKVNAEAVKVAANTLATETALGLIKAEQIKIAANTLLLKTGALMKSSASLQVSASSVDLDTTALETAMAKVKTAVDAVKTAVATGNTEAVKDRR